MPKLKSLQIFALCTSLTALAGGVAWDGKTVPITIEVSKRIHVYSTEPRAEEPRHERGSLYGNADFDMAAGQRFKVIELFREGTCRIEFAGQEYHLRLCPWMRGYADPRADIFKIVEVESGKQEGLDNMNTRQTEHRRLNFFIHGGDIPGSAGGH